MLLHQHGGRPLGRFIQCRGHGRGKYCGDSLATGAVPLLVLHLQVTDIGNGEVHVDVSMEVKFIKSTMFRRLIESNTNSEVTKWLLEFFKYLQKVLLLLLAIA